MRYKEEVSSPPSSSKNEWLPIFHIFLLYHNSSFYDIITTWLNLSHVIHFPHMANCKPLLSMTSVVRPEKFQFMEKGQNRNFHYKIVITVKNP